MLAPFEGSRIESAASQVPGARDAGGNLAEGIGVVLDRAPAESGHGANAIEVLADGQRAFGVGAIRIKLCEGFAPTFGPDQVERAGRFPGGKLPVVGPEGQAFAPASMLDLGVEFRHGVAVSVA
jgi:hypothetical protein